ncbi:MAG: hypothetical protein LC437_02720 [Thiohalomonas sp.]|nr:hypothetical protein [Thiohalomonas sp.]
MMVNHKKVTYTLDQRVINIIERKSYLTDLSQSRWLSNSIQLGFEMMVDDYYDNDKKPLVGAKRKRPNTIPKTFTLPTDVVTTLNWFSEKLGMKKNHLVSASILNFEKTEEEKLDKKIDDLMKSVEEAYSNKYK